MTSKQKCKWCGKVCNAEELGKEGLCNMCYELETLELEKGNYFF